MKFTLVQDWRAIFKKAWSARLMAVAAVMSGVEMVLPLYADAFSRRLFSCLTLAAVIGAFVARFVAQKGLSDGK